MHVKVALQWYLSCVRPISCQSILNHFQEGCYLSLVHFQRIINLLVIQLPREKDIIGLKIVGRTLDRHNCKKATFIHQVENKPFHEEVFKTMPSNVLFWKREISWESLFQFKLPNIWSAWLNIHDVKNLLSLLPPLLSLLCDTSILGLRGRAKMSLHLSRCNTKIWNEYDIVPWVYLVTAQFPLISCFLRLHQNF